MHKSSALELTSEFKSGKKSAVEITSYFLQRCEALDPKLGALLSILSERALSKARALDAKKASGAHLGKLAGVPIILKDNMHIQGELTTCASKILQNYRAPFSATATTLIEKEDGIILGKANMDEFAMGSSTEHSAFKLTRNPWDLERTPGGSSGGSAAAVAAMLAPLSLGSDTGGSIRQPAALCGIHGFKPTYGRVSRFGLVAFGSSFDQIGPFSRSIEDMALMLETIAHPCSRDSTSLTASSEPYLDELKTSLQGKTIGVPTKILSALDSEMASLFQNSLDIFKSLGVKIIEVDLDMIKYSIPMYYILATAEASTNLARFDGVRYGHRSKNAATVEDLYELSKAEGFGHEVKQRILLGTYVLSAGYQDAYYRKAQKVRTLLIQDYKRAFEKCDIIAMPTSPTPAFKLGEIQDPLTMYQQDIYTISANLAGIPAISSPAGLSKSGLPVGIQLQGPALDDARVLRFAYHFERERGALPLPPLFNKEHA